jgi:hypothetical protein
VIDESTGESYFAGTETEIRQIFTFGNECVVVHSGGGAESLVSGRYHPILPSCERRLGWITIVNRPVNNDAGQRGLTFFSAKDYRLLWKIFSEEGLPTTGEIDIRDLIARQDVGARSEQRLEHLIVRTAMLRITGIMFIAIAIGLTISPTCNTTPTTVIGTIRARWCDRILHAGRGTWPDRRKFVAIRNPRTGAEYIPG